MTARRPDAVVVGAGPAGAALALRLAREGWSVLLFERTAYEAARIGESLPPTAAERLVRLGVWQAFLATRPAPVYGVQSAWGGAELTSSSFLGHASGNGWHLNRTSFDEMLSHRARQAGVQLVCHARIRQIERARGGGWLVRAAAPGGEMCTKASFLVDASGRSARVSRELGAGRQRVDRLIGIAMVFTTVDPPLIAAPTLVESHPLGWWYVAGLPDGRELAVFFTDADLASELRLTEPRRWGLLMAESRHARARLSRHVADGSPRSFCADTHASSVAAGEDWVAVGDAAIARDPLSSSGIDFALASAERGAAVLGRAGDGDSRCPLGYAAQVRDDFAAFLVQRRAFYQLEQRWPWARFWARRHRDELEQECLLADPPSHT